MNIFTRILYGLSNVTLPAFKEQFRSYIVWAGEKKPYEYWGGLANLCGLSSIFVFLLIAQFISDPFYRVVVILLASVSVFLFPFGFFMLFFVKAEKRTKEVNATLPNALSLIAANLRAGMTPYQSVKLAAIPEFGVLGDELRIATERSSGSHSFSYYLLEITERINSVPLHRTMRLFVSSMKSGGKMTELLERLSEDISDRAALHNDLITNIQTNVMFIMFIIIIGTPVLLAVSIYFVETITEIQAGVNFSGGAGLAGFGGEISITAQFVLYVSYSMLFFTGLFASFFLGAVVDGDVKKGLRMAPIIIGASYAVFIVARFAINYFLA